MPRIVAFTCPHCGAALSVDADDRDVTCRFCQVTSVVHRTVQQPAPAPPVGGQPWPPTPMPMPAPARSTGGAAVFVVAGVSVLLLLGTLAGVFLLSSQRGSPSTTGKWYPPAEKTLVSEPTGPKTPTYAFAQGHHGDLPLFADANRDGTLDVLALAGFPAKLHAFDGQDGALLWTAAVDGASWARHVAVAESRVIVAGDVTLSLLDVATGKQLAKATLNDRVRRLCAPSGGKLRVLVEDDSVDVVDPANGVVTAEKKGARCDDLFTAKGVEEDTQRRHYPASHLDPALRALRCGNIRVSGTWNYLHPDPCGPALRIDGSKLADLEPDFVVPTEVGQLLIGRRARGRRTPMVGLVDKGTLRWSATLSTAEPAELPEGDARRVVLLGTHVAAVYPGPKGDHLALFDLRHGKRVRDVELPVSAHSLRARGDGKLVVVAKDRILLADRLGKLETLVGPR
jgi:hypothetical protein